MHFEGSIEVPTPKEKFYQFMMDPAKVIGVMPDVQESKIADPEHYFVKAKVGMGYLKGSMSFNFEMQEKRKDEYAKLVGHGQGLQSSVEMTLAIELSGSANWSVGKWSAEASVGGLLASVGGRLTNGAAEKYVKQITENLKTALSAP